MSEFVVLPFEGLDFQWRQMESGQIVVRADEVCVALGWQAKDVSRIVQSKVFPDYRFQDSFGQVGKPPWYLREPGVWQLIFQSNNGTSVRFQRWVFEEVLPKLRAEGAYLSPSATQQQIEAHYQKLQKLFHQRRVRVETKGGKRILEVWRGYDTLEYRTELSKNQHQSYANPQIILIDLLDGSWAIDIDSPMIEAYRAWCDYSDQTGNRRRTRQDLEDWIAAVFPDPTVYRAAMIGGGS